MYIKRKPIPGAIVEIQDILNKRKDINNPQIVSINTEEHDKLKNDIEIIKKQIEDLYIQIESLNKKKPVKK